MPYFQPFSLKIPNNDIPLKVSHRNYFGWDLGSDLKLTIHGIEDFSGIMNTIRSRVCGLLVGNTIYQ